MLRLKCSSTHHLHILHFNIYNNKKKNGRQTELQGQRRREKELTERLRQIQRETERQRKRERQSEGGDGEREDKGGESV